MQSRCIVAYIFIIHNRPFREWTGSWCWFSQQSRLWQIHIHVDFLPVFFFFPLKDGQLCCVFYSILRVKLLSLCAVDSFSHQVPVSCWILYVRSSGKGQPLLGPEFFIAQAQTHDKRKALFNSGYVFYICSDLWDMVNKLHSIVVSGPNPCRIIL